MRLFELFNKTADFKWKDSKDPFSIEAVFNIGGEGYEVVFAGYEILDLIQELDDDGREVPEWLIEFENNVPDLYDVSFYLSSARKSSQKSSWGITGTGNQYEVFSTVIAIIKDFKKKNPDEEWLHIAAAEESRRKLYDRMIKSLGVRNVYEIIVGPEKHYLVRL